MSLYESKNLQHFYINEEQKNQLAPGEKLVSIPAGKWRKWDEITCPFGEFNDPSVTDIQEALDKQQYDVKINGKFDEQTKRALHAFQQDNMLEVGGFSPQTLQRLGVRREKLITIDF